jgi:hypothetical protein
LPFLPKKLLSLSRQLLTPKLSSLSSIFDIPSHSHSHSLLSLVDHSPPSTRQHATTQRDRATQRGRDRDQPTLRDGGDPADSRSPAADLCWPSLYLSYPLSLVLISLSYPLMFRWCRDRRTGQILNLILGFCCFGLMISSEWATGFSLFRFDGRRIGFLFWFDFQWLDFCCFGFLNLMYVIRFFPFWVFIFLVWWVRIQQLGDCRSRPGCTSKISYIYDIGRKKRTDILATWL